MAELKPRQWYAVTIFDRGWVVDTCAGGTYSDKEEDAKWWRTPNDAQEELDASELVEGLTIGKDYEIVPFQR